MGSGYHSQFHVDLISSHVGCRCVHAEILASKGSSVLAVCRLGSPKFRRVGNVFIVVTLNLGFSSNIVRMVIMNALRSPPYC